MISHEYAKGIIAVLSAMLIALSTALGTDGTLTDLSTNDIITILLAALGALGVILYPNTPDEPQEASEPVEPTIRQPTEPKQPTVHQPKPIDPEDL